MSDKHTSKKAASDASAVLRDGRTSAASKSAAASALSQADKTAIKSTGDDAAEKASEVKKSKSTGSKSKHAAGSALSQKEGGKKS